MENTNRLLSKQALELIDQYAKDTIQRGLPFWARHHAKETKYKVYVVDGIVFFFVRSNTWRNTRRIYDRFIRNIKKDLGFEPGDTFLDERSKFTNHDYLIEVCFGAQGSVAMMEFCGVKFYLRVASDQKSYLLPPDYPRKGPNWCERYNNFVRKLHMAGAEGSYPTVVAPEVNGITQYCRDYLAAFGRTPITLPVQTI